MKSLFTEKFRKENIETLIERIIRMKEQVDKKMKEKIQEGYLL